MRIKKRSAILIFFTALGLAISLPALNFTGDSLQAQDSGLVNIIYFPLFGYNEPKPASTSYYLPTVDEVFLYSLGCEQGAKDLLAPGAQDSVTVLNFSYPVYDVDFGYGADLFERETTTAPVSTEAITQGVKGFALGYYNCSGDDTESTLVVGVGTNNKGLSIETTAQATEHGNTWGAMVSDLNQWALDERIIHQVQFYGASNIESWNTPTWTRAWIKGFEQNDDVFYLNFGDAAGCPYDEYPHWTCSGDWSVEDVWYVSWGAPSALPLPLIFLTNGVHAKQWAHLSRYSVESHGFRMDFTGVFTSWQYCQQFSWCDGIDNTPEQAYQQMMEELGKDPSTAQTIRWKTDIRWVHESEVTGTNRVKSPQETNTTTHPIHHEITKLDQALQLTGLSPTLRISLEAKHSIYQAMADKILISQQTPAPKD